MKYYKIETRKPILDFGKPYIKIPQLKSKNNLNLNVNYLNTKNITNKLRSNYTPIRTYNYFKDKKNDIMKATPIKYQYRKIPFQKVKGFKFKLPNNPINIKQLKKKINEDINYPIICEHNNNTIQSNMNNNYNNNTRLETIVHQDDMVFEKKKNNDNIINNEGIRYNKIEKPIYNQIIDAKSSSLGSKYETREESANFIRSKSSLNNIKLLKKEKDEDIIKNFSFLKFRKKQNKIDLSPNQKILKYISKAIKQLTKIKILIKSQTKTKELLNKIKINESPIKKNINIDLSKIGKNLEKYKNIIRIDNNKINLSFERRNQTISTYNDNYILNKRNKNKATFKKLNKTITYDDLKSNNKNGYKKLRLNRINKIEYMNKYNTINNEDKNKIKNFDTEIKIPKIDINYIKKMRNIDEEINKKIKLKDRYKNDNDGESNYYNDERDNTNINTDIANFEFSD